MSDPIRKLDWLDYVAIAIFLAGLVVAAYTFTLRHP